ncbi:MAG: hypothetical protein ACHQIM_10005 [Sphingobacteriales bacterium]
MKNTFKLGFLALVLAISVASCDGNKPKNSSPDSPAAKVDTTAKKDTAKADTTKAKADTAKKK